VQQQCQTLLHVLSCLSRAQVKAFEADIVEALGYKGAIAAADELKGLLDGSKAAGSRKGLAAEQQALFSNLPQVRGCGLMRLISAVLEICSQQRSSAHAAWTAHLHAECM
jgi:histidine ammonia-lyase